MDIHEFGRMGEDVAAAYMETLGYTVVGRNVRVGHSEFDIICKKGRELAFIEVKTRTAIPSQKSRFGPPRRAVDGEKRGFLLRGMMQYLRENDLRRKVSARIDVIEVFASAAPMFTVRDVKYHRNAVRLRSPTDGGSYGRNGRVGGKNGRVGSGDEHDRDCKRDEGDGGGDGRY